MYEEARGVKRKLSDRVADGTTESMGAVVARLRREEEDGSADQRKPSSDATTSGEPGSRTDGRSTQDGAQEMDRATRRKLKKMENNYPALTHSHPKLSGPVKISDLQSLILYILADGTAPQWISVRHHQNFDKVVVLMVPGLDADLFTGAVPIEESTEHQEKASIPEERENHSVLDGMNGSDSKTSPKSQRMRLDEKDYWPSKLAYQKLPGPLKPLVDMFTHLWPVKTPGDYKKMHSPMYAMLSSPIPKSKDEKSKKGPKPPPEARNWKNKRTPITEYIATRSELLENGFALHPAHLNSDAEREVEKSRRHRAVQSPEDGFVDILDIATVTDGAAPESQIQAGSILQGRQLLVMDCEMVSTNQDRFALARVSLIDWDGNTVLDELVKPPDPIKDYLTPYSGITKEMMDSATLTLPNIQAKLKELLTPQTVLGGHSLDSDFRALKIAFPFVVDTSLLYPHPKGPPQKSSLKFLTQKYLEREIQKSSAKGHDSVEDALACLDLIKQKCEKGKAWGTGDASGESIFKRLARSGRVDSRNEKIGSNGHPTLTELGSNGEAVNGHEVEEPRRTGAIVDWTGNMHGFGGSASVAITCTSDEEVVENVINVVTGQSSSSASQTLENDRQKIPTNGVDFTFARLRELEFVRGWSPALPSSSITPTPTPAPLTTSTSNEADTIGATNTTTTTADTAPSSSTLTKALTTTISHIQKIHSSLPPRTAFILLSGSGSPLEMIEMQKMYAAHKAEFLVKKWDELEIKWTDVEEQRLRKAVEKARRGVGFVGVK